MPDLDSPQPPQPRRIPLTPPSTTDAPRTDPRTLDDDGYEVSPTRPRQGQGPRILSPEPAAATTQQRAMGVDQPTQPSLSDMQQPHTWRGQRQPPVGARLLQTLNFLSDEDIDRRRDWSRELDESEAWVNDMLARCDENRLGDETIKLLHQAAATIQTHRRNEAYHYHQFLPLRIPDPADMPRYAPRLPYDPCKDPIEFSVAGPGCKTAQILPTFPAVPRPWRVVNDLWVTETEAALGLTDNAPGVTPAIPLRQHAIDELANAEDLAMPPQNGPPQTAANNIWVQEVEEYQRIVTDPNDGGLQSWTQYGMLSDGTVSDRNVAGSYLGSLPQDYAQERAGRRAGLQYALRQFHSTENHRLADIANNGPMLVLPGGVRASAARDLDEVRRKAGVGNGRPIKLPELPANQLQRIDGKTDPQGFIANIAQFYKNARPVHAAAYDHAMAELFGGSPDGHWFPSDRDQFTPLPPNNSFHPFAWRGVPAHVQRRQDLLRQMRGMKRLFDRELTIAPRSLLIEMQNAFNRGHNGQEPGHHIQLVADRDLPPAGHSAANEPHGFAGNPTPTFLLEEVELEWIRFLLNNSTTKEGTKKLLPRTTLFVVFAVRLQRIFNDPGDTLFAGRNTSVGIEDLIAHMANMKGPVQKTTFYPYDVKMFLERLAHQGRCRYTEDWRTYGQVQRPLVDYHPEHLIIWQPRDNANADPVNFIEDRLTETPRFTDRLRWVDIIQNDPPGDTLDANVRNYFLCLAYKWGQSMAKLEYAEPTWTTLPPMTVRDNTTGMDALNNGYRAVTGTHRSRQLKQLWRATLNRGPDDKPKDAAGNNVDPRHDIQRRVLDEYVRADNMLYPGRTTNYLDPLAPKTRESIWDWARPSIRGKSKQFFSLNRWPLELQSANTQLRIKNDFDVDERHLWNPIVEDMTPWTYYRPKARPYGEDRVKFRAGQRLFPIGDSARQREVVKNQIMNMVGTAMGVVPDPDANLSFFQRIKEKLGIKRKRVMDNPDDDDDLSGDEHLEHRHKLPRLDPERFPDRFDRVAEAEDMNRRHEDATRPVAMPTDQVPMHAIDALNSTRRAPVPGDGLFVEQNMPLSVPASQQ